MHRNSSPKNRGRTVAKHILFLRTMAMPFGTVAWKGKSKFSLAALIILIAALSCQTALAIVEFCDVYVGQEKIFSVTNTQMLSALERGEEINERIKTIVSDTTIDPNTMSIRTGMDGVPVIVLGNKVILGVTSLDAAQANKTQQVLAQEWCDKLKRQVLEQRKVLLQDTSAQTGTVSTSHRTARSKGSNSSLSEHAILLLFVEISLLLIASLICGEIMVKLGQPSIIGQILAGLLLGQSFFGLFFPDLSAQLFPRDGSQSRLIEVISWIGVSFLLMLTGMETDTAMLKRLGKSAVCFGLLGLIGPLIAGGIVSLLLPAQLMGSSQNKLAFAVFLGTVFAASSVPVIAKILMDMKMFKLDVGQLIIAASLAHDLLCCLLLAVIVVLAGPSGQGSNPVLIAIVGTVCFLAVMYFGRPIFFKALRWINDHISNSDGLITAMIVLLMSSAAVTQSLGVHIVLGAFAAGVILSQAPVINRKVVRPIEIVTMAFFAPIFFASSGLNVNLSILLEPNLGTITLLLAIAALAVKVASCLWAGKLAGLGRWESLSVGVGANAKGSLGLILAMLGYSLNIIALDMYAVIIFISLFSTAITAPLMKLTMSKVKVSDEEKLRMKREERSSRTILSTVRRVLWPTSGRGRNRFVAHLLNSMAQRQVIETTALWVKQPGADIEKPFAGIDAVVDRKHVSVYEKTIRSDEPLEVISEEANHGYDLIIMASDDPPADATSMFGHLVDGVIINTNTRVLVVYEPDISKEREIKRVLVPVSGSELSVAAAEFGISLAKSLAATVVCLSVAESEVTELYSDATQSGQKIEAKVSDEISNTLSELSNALDVDFRSILMRTSSHPAQAVILAAQQNDADLIVLGAEAKRGKGLFMGHTVNFILRNAPCAIAVLKLQG